MVQSLFAEKEASVVRVREVNVSGSFMMNRMYADMHICVIGEKITT
jgi:IMP dehydrogenase/GMP reductase